MGKEKRLRAYAKLRTSTVHTHTQHVRS